MEERTKEMESPEVASNNSPPKSKLLDEKIIEYSDSLTMHGLSRIINGRFIESCLWFLVCVTGCVFIVLLVLGLVTKFLRKEVYLDFKTFEHDPNDIPMVTLCFDRATNPLYYCDAPLDVLRVDQKTTNTKPCNVSEQPPFDVALVCQPPFCQQHFRGAYAVTYPSYATSLPFRQTSAQCFLFNLTDLHGKQPDSISLKFRMDNSRDFLVDVIIHENQTYPVLQKSHVRLSSQQTNTEMRIDKSVIKRLPAPFPSHCTEKKSPEDIFPGNYTKQLCVYSRFCVSVYKACGATLDACREFIPRDVIKEFKRTRSQTAQANCLIKQWKKHNDRCNVQCEETTFYVSVVSYPAPYLPSNTFVLNVSYPNTHFYHWYEEKELYSIDQLISETGGLIGLFLGGSVLSLVEVLTLLCLVLAKKAFRESA